MNLRLSKIFQISLALLLFYPIVKPQTPSQPDSSRGVGNNKTLQYVENEQFKQVPLYDNSYALVIGMTDYQDNAWRDLKGPETDVKEVKNVLTEHGFNVEVEMNLTGKDLEEKLSAFIKKYGLDGNNRIIVYFSGHGETITAKDGREVGYIVPIDAPASDQTDFKRIALGMDRIESFAKQIETKHALFVFDSCFSGQLLNASKGSIIPPYISRYLEKPSRQFITSGSSTQTVPDDSKFRSFFVEGLRGNADNDKDGYITASELGNYLYKQVTDSSRGFQTPQQGRIQDQKLKDGDMVFFLKLSQSSMTEEQRFEEAKAKNTIQSWTIFLNSGENEKYKNEGINMLIKAVKLDKEKNQIVSNESQDPIRITRGQSLKPVPFEVSSFEVKNKGGSIQRIKLNLDSFEEDLGNGLIIKLVRIPAGEFEMGNKEYPERSPVRKVKISEFLMGVYEVTKEQWKAVASLPRINIKLPENPAPDLVGDKMPITNISWDEAKEFCARLNVMTKREYSLPTEAEWEYAARAKNYETLFAFGNKLNRDLVNYKSDADSTWSEKGIYRNQPIKVGTLEFANNYGLFDMHGNVAEWCQDGWATSYEDAPTDGSARTGMADDKVVRGGAYNVIAQKTCSTCRNNVMKNVGFPTIGFRLVLKGGLNNSSIPSN